MAAGKERQHFPAGYGGVHSAPYKDGEEERVAMLVTRPSKYVVGRALVASHCGSRPLSCILIFPKCLIHSYM